MHATLWIASIASALSLLLAGCASTPDAEQSPAGVEERKPGAAGPQTQGIRPPGVGQVDLTAKVSPSSGLAMLKDPNNILSKRSIFYDLDKFDIRDEYKALVEAHGRFLRDNPGIKMLIQGNTDERGSREYNIGLGQRRSEGVKRVLQLLGAKEAQIESVSLGEEKPRAEGHTEEAWAQNRRSDILYQGEY